MPARIKMPNDREFRFMAHGVSACVRIEYAQHTPAFEALALDFAAFPRSFAPPDILVNLVPAIPSEAKRPWRLGRLPNAEVFGFGETRVCVYPDGVSAESKRIGDVRHFWIAGANVDIVREVAYTAILSALGEELDVLGFHRAHALGLNLDGRNLLLLGPSGAGKSSLATLLLRDPAIKLFSDESPLLRGRTVYPFPLRMALIPEVAIHLGVLTGETFRRHRFKPKKLLSVRVEQVGVPGEIDFLLMAGKHAADPSIQTCSRFKAAPALFANIVVGFGLAQMTEWMVRADSLPRLIGIGFRRVGLFLRLLFGAKPIYVFNLSMDPNANAACLRSFVKARKSDRQRLRQPLATLIAWMERPLRLSVFRPLHEATRRLLLRRLMPALDRTLQRRMQDARFHLIPRNSLLKAGAYRIFRSDIDCSLIVPDTATPAQIGKAREIFERWRRRWLMLGELEIYTESEQRLEFELIQQFGPLLECIRLLRKWKFTDADAATTEYHREKARLGQHAIFKKLTGREYSEPVTPQISQALEAFLSQQFPELRDLPAPPGTWSSSFLGWDLSASGRPNALVLPTQLPVLLAILPDIHSAPAPWLCAIHELRRTKRISNAYFAIVAHEYLLCRSVSRDPSRDTEELREWLRVLRTATTMDRSNLEPYKRDRAPSTSTSAHLSDSTVRDLMNEAD